MSIEQEPSVITAQAVVHNYAAEFAVPGTVRYEWAYCSRWEDGSDHVIPCHNEDEARMFAEAKPTRPGITRRVMCRAVHTGPWVTVQGERHEER